MGRDFQAHWGAPTRAAGSYTAQGVSRALAARRSGALRSYGASQGLCTARLPAALHGPFTSPNIGGI